MSFESALSGLNAATADLNVTGNNIANGHTVGFKGSRAEFADVFAMSHLGISQNAIGQGVRLTNVQQSFTQGQFEFTGNSLDLGVSGQGFYRMSTNGAISYTRAGNFQIDRDGFLVNPDGARLTGYAATPEGTITGALSPLKITSGDVAPRATNSIDMRANMHAHSPVIEAAVDFDAEDPETYSFSTSTTVYDSVGRDHLHTFYFVKREDADGVFWEAHSRLADHEAEPTETIIRFNTDGTVASINGESDPPEIPSISYGANGPLAGTGGLNIDLNFRDLTQFGTPFSVSELNQNGYSAGQFASLNVESDGIIYARYTNGQSMILGQVALTKFPSPQNLQQVGNTSWVQTYAAGDPMTGKPGSGDFGRLQSGALEQSNVNIGEQLVKMITAQRSYQANAKMISTHDSITQELLNIRR